VQVTPKMNSGQARYSICKDLLQSGYLEIPTDT
jgi:hypothetical protein